MEKVAHALLTYETVSGDEIEKLLGGTTVEDLRPEPPEAPSGGSAERRESPAPEAPKGDARPGDLPGEPGLSPA